MACGCNKTTKWRVTTADGRSNTYDTQSEAQAAKASQPAGAIIRPVKV